MAGGAKQAAEVNPDEVQPVTPEGAKKVLSKSIAKAYEPAAVEHAWYAWWEAQVRARAR